MQFLEKKLFYKKKNLKISNFPQIDSVKWTQSRYQWLNMSSWSSAGRQERRTKGTCIQSSLDGTSKFDGFYTISMDYRSGLSILEEKIPHNLLLFVLHVFLYRESLWFWYILIYSTYSLIIPKKNNWITRYTVPLLPLSIYQYENCDL